MLSLIMKMMLEANLSFHALLFCLFVYFIIFYFLFIYSFFIVYLHIFYFIFFICSEFCHTLKWKGLGFKALSLSSEIILSHLQDSKNMLTPWSFVSLILLVMSLLSITLLPSQAFTVTYSPSMTREAALPLLHLWYLIITAWCGVKRQPQVEKYWISSKM